MSRSRGVIRRFTFRRTLRGAIIFGLFAGLENIAQAFGIVAAYPTAAQRVQVIHGLSSNPALGLLYGDPHGNIASAAGYMVYRTSMLLAVVAGVWGLLTATRMLRGQEEDGRWELLLTGSTTAVRATRDTLLGFGMTLGIAYLLTVLIIAGAGSSSKVQVSLAGSLYYGLALLASAVLFAAVGALTSQLAATRRRAVLYGLLLLLVCYSLRAIGNVASSLVWLKDITPFGWIDHLRPLGDAQPMWLLPLGLTAALCAAGALIIAGRRDLGDSVVADKTTARPHLRLLGSPLGLSLRMSRGLLLSWLLGSLLMSAIVASIAKTAAQSLVGTSSVSGAIAKLSGGATTNLELAFLSISGYLVATILMVMVITGLGSVREEEGRGRLDNFLVGVVSRTRWLSGRLLLLATTSLAICLLSSVVVWLVAMSQQIQVDAVKLVFGGLNVLGPIFLMLGVGTMLYGLWPRLTTTVLYAWLAWSFTADIIASIVKLNKAILNTSLLHQIALTPAADPKWSTFAILSLSGMALMILGTLAFQRRDLIAE
jgi:ABC-2 type transport system permease protein